MLSRRGDNDRGSTLVCRLSPPVTLRMRRALPPMLPDALHRFRRRTLAPECAPLCEVSVGYSFRSLHFYDIAYSIRHKMGICQRLKRVIFVSKGFSCAPTLVLTSTIQMPPEREPAQTVYPLVSVRSRTQTNVPIAKGIPS